MSSILEKLYQGKIHHNFWLDCQTPAYQQFARLKGNSHEKLLATLSEPQKELLEKYIDIADDLAEISRYNTYEHAVRFGAVFVAEAFVPPFKSDNIY